MLSSERVQPVAGPNLLEQLGRLIVRARSDSPSQKQSPSTSQVHIQTQPDEVDPRLEAHLSSHINALWTEQIPVCVEVLLAPECAECYAAMTSAEPCAPRGLLLERWTMEALLDKSESPSVISSPWLLNAVRSQLHFSQLSAWRARMQPRQERRRKLSREQSYKKVESSCVETDRKLMVIYSVHNGDRKVAEFRKPPSDHTFPLTDIGNNKYLKVVLESLPRIEDIPDVKCACKRTDVTTTDELVGRLNDLNIGSRKYDGAINSNIGTPSRRLSILSNPDTDYIYPTETKDILDDRMHTPCNENGKHKCNCDDESDGKEKRKLDERRLKEIAKYKRKIRKEFKKYDSTSSEGEKTKETTSIPILQASRFDRFRAIGCYRNQTYLTLPASRIETKSPFIETDNLLPEFNKTIEKTSIGTQTDFVCDCGKELEMKCDSCNRGMVRSQANYNLASLGARRKLDEQDNEKSLKKLKCDTNVDSFSDGVVKRPKLKRFLFSDRLDKIVTDRNRNTEKDIRDLHLKTDDSVFSTPNETKTQHENHHTIKTDGLDLEHVSEPSSQNGGLVSRNGGPSFKLDYDSRFNLNMDETFSTRKENKRQKTFSLSDDDYVFYEKCDYGTIDRHEVESPQEEKFKFSSPEKSETPGPENLQPFKGGFVFPEPKRDHCEVPSPSEMERFRWRFDSAASMVFHSKTGLPLTSSPAPLRRGNSCFDFDDSINGISGIKSALFHPISPVSPGVPASPASPAPLPRPPTPRRGGKLKVGSSTGLLGSFEESALQGRLEAVATVHGFTAELGASGAFCPPHKRLPVTVFFYAPGGTAAPYMGHIALGPGGYRVARSGTVQVSLFNPHGTLVKMFVVLYDLTRMPHAARTFLRQRTLYMPCGAAPPADQNRWLRYLIHLRFMTSKSGKLYLHTDIRLIVSRKADLDTATAHSALLRPPASLWRAQDPPNRAPPNRVFGGASEQDSDDNSDEPSVSYELRSFTYAPDNPKYSPR